MKLLIGYNRIDFDQQFESIVQIAPKLYGVNIESFRV